MRNVLLLLLVATISTDRSVCGTHTGGIILAGEPVQFDNNLTIRFSGHQLRETSPATRAGLVRWAATRQGKRLLRFFSTPEYRIVVIEDPNEPAEGRAPQPGIATLMATHDRTKTKTYELILNPTPRNVPEGMKPMPHEPATTADLLAAAWAAEMLHIELYARGVQLPHHQRDDFQEAWLSVAAELGFPAMTHGGDDQRGSAPASVFIIGEPREPERGGRHQP